MIQKLVLFLVLGVLIAAVLLTRHKLSRKEVSTIPSLALSPTAIPTQVPLKKRTSAIFVPYWADFKYLNAGLYDRVIYFGIAPTLKGIDKNEQGYRNLAKFQQAVGKTQQKLLTVRIVDSDLANNILSNEKSWEKIVNGSTEIAKDYQFNGIVLDLEVSNLPLTDVANSITSFVQYFSEQTRGQNLYFATTLYGDNFYRKRPYDIFTISPSVDEIMIMAYDLHKAGGEAGPNFPLKGGEKYDYDLKTLITDLSGIPPEKLSVIFGMYGYDWVVDMTKKPIRPAKAVTDLEVKKKFIDSCQWKNCIVYRDPLSAETEINYIDENLLYHIVWFEDVLSTETKQKFLESKGIGSVIYWAYGYF